MDEREVESNEADLLGYLDRLSGNDREKSLQPIDATTDLGGVASVVQPLADPREPLELERAAGRMWTMRTILAVWGLAAALGGLALAWQYTLLSDFADDRIRVLGHLRDRNLRRCWRSLRSSSADWWSFRSLS